MILPGAGATGEGGELVPEGGAEPVAQVVVAGLGHEDALGPIADASGEGGAVPGRYGPILGAVPDEHGAVGLRQEQIVAEAIAEEDGPDGADAVERQEGAVEDEAGDRPLAGSVDRWGAAEAVAVDQQSVGWNMQFLQGVIDGAEGGGVEAGLARSAAAGPIAGVVDRQDAEAVLMVPV